jgi:hypothetical protein
MEQAEWPVPLGARADVGLGDRVVAAEHDRDRPRVHRLADGVQDGGVRGDRIGRDHGGVAEVDDAQLGHRVDAHLEVRAGEPARRPDRPRPVARARRLRHELVHRGADDRDVDARELAGVLGVGHAGEGEQPGVVGLVAVRPPRGRIQHAGDPRRGG